MPDTEESDDEIEAPPERRAPSGRSGRGRNMQKLIAEEEDEKEDEEEEDDTGDKSFYTQDFWADAEEDVDFAGDADDEEARDSFDSDFGDSTESDDDDDDDEGAAKKKSQPKKKSVYRDPKLAHKKGEGPSSSGGAPAPKKVTHKKRPRAEGGEGGIVVVEERQKTSFRSSTQTSTVRAEENRAKLDAAAKARAEKAKTAGAKRGVELVRLTQHEILAEAAQTEIINRASLERMLRIAEEQRRVTVRERKTDGPRVKLISRREGNSVISTVSFVDHPVPSAIDGIAPPYPTPLRCAVTGLPAKYRDPQTGKPYANLEAFRTLRGRTGRRQQHSFSGDAAAPAAHAAPAE